MSQETVTWLIFDTFCILAVIGLWIGHRDIKRKQTPPPMARWVKRH